MATQTSIVYNATTALGKSTSKSLTHVNQEAGGTVLEAFASKVNALSTGIYGGTTRIDKTDLDDTSVKPVPTLSLGQETISFAAIKAAIASAPFGIYVDINYDGDGQVYSVNINDPSYRNSLVDGFGYKVVYVDGAPKLFLTTTSQASYNSRNSTFVIRSTETENFAAAELSVQVTN